MKAYTVKEKGREFRVETEPVTGHCWYTLVRVYEIREGRAAFCGKVVSNDIGAAVKNLIGKA